MMTSLTAVDLFVWHESLGGGGRRAGLMSSSNLLLSGDPRLLVLVLSWGESFSSHCLEAPFQSQSLDYHILSLFQPFQMNLSIPSPCLGGVLSQSLSRGILPVTVIRLSYFIALLSLPSPCHYCLEATFQSHMILFYLGKPSSLSGLILWFFIKNHTLFVQSDFVLVLPWS